MGQPTGQVLELRAALNQGKMLGSGDDRHRCNSGWRSTCDPSDLARSWDARRPARAAVRQQAEAGVDEIKVYSSLDKDVFLAILDEARQVGLKVVGHVPDSIYLEDARGGRHGKRRASVWLREGHRQTTDGTRRGERYTGMAPEVDYFQRLRRGQPGETCRGSTGGCAPARLAALPNGDRV